MGIPTSQNPDTLEGLECRLSVGIRRILVELLHSTKLELQKTPSNPNRFWQSFCAQDTPKTLDKLGSPLTLRTLPLSLLYKE
jgi:hypothetical protein